MERRKGTFVLNNSRDSWAGRAQAIHVIAETTFTAIRDNKNKDASYYISTPAATIPAGTYIVARDGALFSNVTLTSGAIEIIF
jgi:hypothetical protein